MPYAYCLASVVQSCSLDVFCSTLLNAAQLVHRYSPYWSSACLWIWGFAAPFIQGVLHCTLG